MPGYYRYIDKYIYTVYIDKSHVPTNFLVYAELNSNSLERALRLNAPEHSTISEHITSQQSLDKNILRHCCWAKREKGYMHQAIVSESDVISHNTRAAPQGDAIIIS